MANAVQFTVNTKTFSNALTGLLKLWSSKPKDRIISIRACGDNIKLCIPGGMTKVKAEVLGEACIITPAKLIIAYIKTTSSGSITFKFSPGQLECGSSVFHTNAIELSSLEVERDYEPEINLSHLSLVRMAYKFSPDEITHGALSILVKKDKVKFKNNIEAASDILKVYGISFDELEDFVLKKIKAIKKKKAGV